MRSILPGALLLLLGGLAPGSGHAEPPCRAAISAAEQAFAIPAGLLAAIGAVESGRRGADGVTAPWPWTINAEGAGQAFDSKPAAIAAVRALQAGGMRSIDVGCLQVNLMHHPDAFASLEAAFDPVTNAIYAARFLAQLHATTGDWRAAAALYHSATPALAAEYRRRVMAAWPAAQAAALPLQTVAMRRPGGMTLTPGGGLPGHVLPWHNAPAAIIRLPGGQGGRNLTQYRAAPIPLANGRLRG